MQGDVVSASRKRQRPDRIDAPDLNLLLKAGTLDLPTIAEQIGAAIARWQTLEPAGFGPFDPARVE